MTFLLWSFDLGLSNLLWLADVDAYGVQFRLEWPIFFSGVCWLAGSAVINDFLLLWSFDFGFSSFLWLADMDAYGVEFTHKQLIFFWGVGWLAGLVEISYFFCCGVCFGFVRFVMTHRYGRLWRTLFLPFWYWRLFVSKISTYFNMTSINIIGKRKM